MDDQANSILQRQFPKIAAHKSICAYRFSVNATSEFCPSYDWDKPVNNPNQELIEAQRELENLEDQLNNKRKNLKNIHETLDEQWHELEENQEKLKDKFIKFNQFIKSNEEKRNRAKNSLDNSKEQFEILDTKTKELQRKYEYLQNIKKDMDQKIEESRIYEVYLDKVIPLMPAIHNFHQLIKRYEALLEARQDLVKRKENHLKSLEETKKNTLKIIEENNMKIGDLARQMSHTHSRFEFIRKQTLKWEEIVNKIKNEIFKNYRVKDQVEKSIYNLYLLMCKRKQIRPVHKLGEFEKQLDFIKKALEETTYIHEILMKINQKKQRPTKS